MSNSNVKINWLRFGIDSRIYALVQHSSYKVIVMGTQHRIYESILMDLTVGMPEILNHL